jgi:hypothetical protein
MGPYKNSTEGRYKDDEITTLGQVPTPKFNVSVLWNRFHKIQFMVILSCWLLKTIIM